MFLIGPSHVLPLSVGLMYTGLGAIGITCSLCFVPGVPEIIRAYNIKLE